MPDVSGFSPLQRRHLWCGAGGRTGLFGAWRAPCCCAAWDWPALSPGGLESLRGIAHWGALGGQIGGGVVLRAPPVLLHDGRPSLATPVDRGRALKAWTAWPGGQEAARTVPGVGWPGSPSCQEGLAACVAAFGEECRWSLGGPRGTNRWSGRTAEGGLHPRPSPLL
ncbi:hypothetical protein NDU88_006137 [Pleurodeles waltl]|uniref:Uncharacterized protein n=1 Tax=Pleurodeles waltl TaxID=8319 RepID=A0AAV7MCF4_PLEWA|nr:hypothetical protein NDU88_006137 [Pleurodeles waltl]